MRTFSLDMIPGGAQTAVACNQYESGDVWLFSLYYDGGRYEIPTGAEVSITGTKPDGAAYNIAGTVVDNAVVITVTDQITACAGRSIAEILVESETDGTTLYSANFPLLVEPAAVQGEFSPSEIPSAIVDTDGNVYYSAEYIPEVSGGVPTEVRQAMKTLFSKAAYIEEGLADEAAVITAWAEATTSITVSPASASVSSASPTAQLSAVTTPAGGAVTWASSNTAVATVSSTGLVTGVGNGTATITATSGTVSASCAVTASGFVMHSVTNYLTNATTSNPATQVIAEEPYSATLSGASGYDYDAFTVSVVMGDTDITSTVYEDGVITIPSVTDDVVITVGTGSIIPLTEGEKTFTSYYTATVKTEGRLGTISQTGYNSNKDAFTSYTNPTAMTTTSNSMTNEYNDGVALLTIPAGSSVTVECVFDEVAVTDKTGNTSKTNLHVWGNGTTAAALISEVTIGNIADIVEGQSYSNTFTVEADTPLHSLGLYIDTNYVQSLLLKYRVRLSIDGTRYI